MALIDGTVVQGLKASVKSRSEAPQTLDRQVAMESKLLRLAKAVSADHYLLDFYPHWLPNPIPDARISTVEIYATIHQTLPMRSNLNMSPNG